MNVCPRCLCSRAKHLAAELWRWDECKRSRENNPIKMNVCEKNQPLAVFLHFYQKSLPGTVYILTRKRKRSLYFVFFYRKKNQRELCWFPAVSWVIYISFEIARWNFVLCCIHRCMQSRMVVLKSGIKGKVKYVLSPVPYSLVNQLLVKIFKIFISTNKIITKHLVCFVAICIMLNSTPYLQLF